MMDLWTHIAVLHHCTVLCNIRKQRDHWAFSMCAAMCEWTTAMTSWTRQPKKADCHSLAKVALKTAAAKGEEGHAGLRGILLKEQSNRAQGACLAHTLDTKADRLVRCGRRVPVPGASDPTPQMGCRNVIHDTECAQLH